MNIRLLNLLILILNLISCAVIPRDVSISTAQYPLPREEKIKDYYSYNKENPYLSYTEKVLKTKKEYTHKKEEIVTEFGNISIDYFQGKKESENLIFIFPILGGKTLVETYFAKYFVKQGFDTAIVNRDKDFKRPEMFDRLEEIFRKNVIRDRIAIDFFEKNYNKKNFGSFGISRGAINAAITAGVDPRLKYNVFVMGGSHIVDIFKNSDVGGIKKYRKRVEKFKNINDKEFYEHLENTIFSDPKNLAKYINPEKTLLFLSFFDNAVPFKYGMKFRKELGTPKTIFLASGHYTALLYTQFLKILLPFEGFCIFPNNFIETKSLDFYNEAFGTNKVNLWQVPFYIIQLPFNILGHIYYHLI